MVQPIAAGGMGEVFLARDEKLDRLVAIKLLRDGFDNDELRGRFEAEARNVAKLTHPNIVTIYEYGAHDGRPYIAMEYVAGHSMAELIRRRTPLSVARRVRLIEELCSGLGHAHKAHLVHRDVKPANLMVTTSGMLKVLDFGIAKLRGTDRTQKGMLIGTLNYMSPEQITGKPVDHRSDIFAVGAVLHEVLTYEQAFKGDLTTAMFAIVHGEPEPLAERCPELDAAFQDVVNRCLAKDPDARYQDLGLLKRELGRLRRPLEEDDGDLPEALGFLDVEKTMVFRQPASDAEGKAVGPDTRRALGSALVSGEAAIERGQFDSAERHAEQALALESSNASAQDLRSRARKAREAATVASQVGHAREALEADQIDVARAALATAAKLAPDSPTIRGLAGQVDQRAADLERFDRSVALARERLGAYDFEEARDLAETAELIRPKHSELGRLRDEIERADAARRAWIGEQLAEVDDLLARQDFDGALARVEEACAESPHTESLRVLASQVRAAWDAALRAEDERQREIEAGRRAEEARQRELVEQQRLAEARAQRIATLLDTARRTAGPVQARRDAAAEVLRLDPGDAEAARLLPPLDAALAETARQKALDAALAAGEALLAKGELDASAAKAAEVVKARPDDARAATLASSIVEARRKREAAREALKNARALAATGRWDDAEEALKTLDAREIEVVALLTSVGRGRAREHRHRQVAAVVAQVQGIARNRGVQAGMGAVGVVALTIWLWPAPAPEPTVDPTTGEPAVGAPLGPSVLGSQMPAPANPSLAVPGTTSPNPPDPGPDRSTPPNTPPSPAPTKQDAPQPEVTVPQPERPAIKATPSPTDPPTPGNAPARPRDPLSPSNNTTPRPASVSPDREGPIRPVSPPDTSRLTPPPVKTTPVDTPPPVETAPKPPEVPLVLPGPVAAAGTESIRRQTEELQIRSAIGQFGRAYQEKDLNGMKEAWPGMDRGTEGSYREVFRSYRKLGWTLLRSTVNIAGDSATVRCDVQVEQVELRSDRTIVNNRSYQFRFQRQRSGWTIVEVANLRAGQ